MGKIKERKSVMKLEIGVAGLDAVGIAKKLQEVAQYFADAALGVYVSVPASVKAANGFPDNTRFVDACFDPLSVRYYCKELPDPRRGIRGRDNADNVSERTLERDGWDLMQCPSDFATWAGSGASIEEYVYRYQADKWKER